MEFNPWSEEVGKERTESSSVSYTDWILVNADNDSS